MTPLQYADDLNLRLDDILPKDKRYGFDLTDLALNIVPNIFPDEPITLVTGADLHGFDGALLRHPAKPNQWGIIYSEAIPHPGRIRFTIAHELGHYFMHRQLANDQGFQCLIEKSSQGDELYRKREQEANAFAAEILMPRTDFRSQIFYEPFSFDLISHCASRYEVSQAAALSRWIELTHQRAIVVSSCDGFMLWAKSSAKAHASGYYFATRKSTIAIPPNTDCYNAHSSDVAGRPHPDGVWFENREVTEFTQVNDKSEFVTTVLVLT